jgi:hypothetical protein
MKQKFLKKNLVYDISFLMFSSATLKPEQLVYLVVGGATPELTLE